MTARVPPRLCRTVHPAVLLGLVAVAAGLGVADARVLLDTDPTRRPDIAFKLAALPALPLPPLLLGLLTTPRHAVLRRMLGQTATATLRAALREAASWTCVALAVPVAMALAGQGSEDVWRAAALAAMSVVLAGGLGTALLLLALRAVAAASLPHAGPARPWQALAGGGAFGPAEATPLLYAPALAFVAAIVPPALLSAVWGAAPELLPVQGLVWPIAGSVLLSLMVARTQVRAIRPLLQDALLAVEQAHAVTFATAGLLPEPPRWLMPGRPEATVQFLARAWVRRWPGSALASAGLVALAVWLVAHPGPWWAGTWAACLAFYGAVRVAALEQDPSHGAARWLGAAPARLRTAELRLAIGLSLPTLLAALLVLRGASGLALAVGAAVGLAAAVLALVALRSRRAGLPGVALLLVAVALACATAVRG